jgi:hypothetical protein
MQFKTIKMYKPHNAPLGKVPSGDKPSALTVVKPTSTPQARALPPASAAPGKSVPTAHSVPAPAPTPVVSTVSKPIEPPKVDPAKLAADNQRKRQDAENKRKAEQAKTQAPIKKAKAEDDHGEQIAKDYKTEEVSMRKYVPLSKILEAGVWGSSGGWGDTSKGTGDAIGPESKTKNYILKKKNKVEEAMTPGRKKLSQFLKPSLDAMSKTAAELDKNAAAYAAVVKKHPAKPANGEHTKCGTPDCCGKCSTAVNEVNIRDASGKMKNIKNVLMRGADGKLRSAPPGKSSSSSAGC